MKNRAITILPDFGEISRKSNDDQEKWFPRKSQTPKIQTSTYITASYNPKQ